MQIFYHTRYVLPLPPGHRFPMPKYRLLLEKVAAHLCPPHELQEAAPVSDDEILRAHDASYLARVQNGELTEREMRRIGFPWSAQMVERSRRSSGATIAACRAALEQDCGVNLAGGTHHAFRDHGEGYCVFNDSAIAARAMQAEGRAERVVIIDCDVHQGNGTAAIFADDPSVFTFSIHGANNFPFRKEASDLDIELADGTGDAVYLETLEQGLRQALDWSQPQLAIYIAGADPYMDDRLGRLALTKQGLIERDVMVLDACRASGIPVAISMAGGYAKNIEDTVDIHFNTVKLAAQIF